MKLNLLPVLVAGLISAAPASAATLLIDFEGPNSFESVGSYYASQGVTFGLDALTIKNDPDFTFYSNAPSPLGVMSVVGEGAGTMNVAAGFTGTASFFYSSNAAGSVGLWSGLNGTGTLLGSFLLTNNTGSCSDPAFCAWSLASLGFAGTAHSITFGDAMFQGIDDISIAVVPLPAAPLLLSLGVGLLGLFGVRRRAAA